MALPRQYLGHRLGALDASSTLEIYLDYVCPFSHKIYKALRTEVLPWLEKTYPDQVQTIFRHQVQPWHASSTLVHEAALVVEKLHPDQFFDFSDKLFAVQQDYFDEAVENKTRRQLVEQVADLVAETTGSSKDDIIKLLANGTGTPAQNKGNAITNDLKWHVRFARQNAIHVSPTVVWNGIRDDSVSSSWTLAQWQEYLKAKL